MLWHTYDLELWSFNRITSRRTESSGSDISTWYEYRVAILLLVMVPFAPELCKVSWTWHLSYFTSKWQAELCVLKGTCASEAAISAMPHTETNNVTLNFDLWPHSSISSYSCHEPAVCTSELNFLELQACTRQTDRQTAGEQCIITYSFVDSVEIIHRTQSADNVAYRWKLIKVNKS